MPYLVAYLGGEVEITTTDGETRSFKPGDVSVQVDVKGRGHKNRVVGRSHCEFLLVELAEPTAYVSRPKESSCFSLSSSSMS